MKIIKNRKETRRKRHDRVRRKVSGTGERPRMALMISNRNMYVQFIDDDNSRTVAAVSTLGGDVKVSVVAAKELGKRAADLAMSKGVKAAVVDRGGFKYHGRIKAIVEGAAEAGLRISDKPLVVTGESKEEEA